MKRDLLVHSMSHFASITLPILEAVNAKNVAEIGAEHGGNSKLLANWLSQKSGKLTSIDCAPSQAFLNWLPEVNQVVQHVHQASLDVLSDIPPVDAWFIDGDHNWYTVYHELILIHEQSKKHHQPLLIFMHDVSWPWARRDLYYAPDRIPEAYRHPLTWDKGVTLDNPDVIDGGFRSNGEFAFAIREGGPRNGVLTAVEDFINEHPKEFCFANIPAIFGLGVLFDASHPCAEQIAAIVAPFNNNELLQKLEVNRLDNYLKVIEWQDNASKDNAASNAAPAAASDTANQQLEQQAVALINLLDTEQGNPDVWKMLDAALPQNEQPMIELMSYLGMLLQVPQEPNALKLIALLQAICLAKVGGIKEAHAILEKLHEENSSCQLVLGAYRQTLSLATSE